jgi:oligoribonuclease NrnB/cAMP/cGMP phosphodiesterase (DHH superfamily)
MKLFVYTHKKDLDGISAAAIMYRYAKKNELDAEIDFIDYSPTEELQDTFNRMKGIPSWSTLVLADFGYDANLEPYARTALEELNKRNVMVYWLDHHNWDANFKTEISKLAQLTVAESKESCGAELVYSKFMPDDKVSEALAKLGRDSDIDMWQAVPPTPNFGLTVPLGSVITYRNYTASGDTYKRHDLLFSLVKDLANASLDDLLSKETDTKFFDTNIRKDWESYKGLEKTKLAECINSAELMDIGHYRVAVSRADPIISTTVGGNAIVRNYHVDVSILINEFGTIGIRRDNGGNVDCSAIARLFGGGGHVFAAGADLGFTVRNEEDLKKAKELLKSKLPLVLDK